MSEREELEACGRIVKEYNAAKQRVILLHNEIVRAAKAMKDAGIALENFQVEERAELKPYLDYGKLQTLLNEYTETEKRQNQLRDSLKGLGIDL